MLTRKQIIDTIEAYDGEIDALQSSKRDTFTEQREALTDEIGKEAAREEIDALKKVIQRRRQIAKHGVQVVEDRDARVEEILAEIEASHAPRAARVENIDEFRPETGKTEPANAGDGSAADGGEGGKDAPALSATQSQEPVDGDHGPASGALRASPAGAEGDEDRQPITDITAPRGVEGEAANVAASPANPRVMTRTPLEPRTAGGLKGFGFTVNFEDAAPVGDGDFPRIPHRGVVAAS